jgi:hypothetical protein
MMSIEYRLAGTLKRKENLSSAFEKADSSIGIHVKIQLL